MIKCCIIDDEPLARELLEGYVHKTPFLQLVGSFESGTEAVKTIIAGEIDLLFLDINMPCINGIEFAEIVPPSCRIVFVTAYEQYALKGYKVNAIDYLLKPVDYQEFFKAANKVAQWHSMNRAYIERGSNDMDCIIVKSGYKLVQININDILYIEGQKDYIRIYLDSNQEPISSLINLKSLESILPAYRFIRVHRSFIVNTSKIRIIERNRIVFGKTYIPISDSHRQQYNDYIHRHMASGTTEQ